MKNMKINSSILLIFILFIQSLNINIVYGEDFVSSQQELTENLLEITEEELQTENIIKEVESENFTQNIVSETTSESEAFIENKETETTEASIQETVSTDITETFTQESVSDTITEISSQEMVTEVTSENFTQEIISEMTSEPYIQETIIDKALEGTTDEEIININPLEDKEKTEIIIKYKDEQSKHNFKKLKTKILYNTATSSSSIQFENNNTYYNISGTDILLKEEIKENLSEVLYVDSKYVDSVLEKLKSDDNLLYAQLNYNFEVYSDTDNSKYLKDNNSKNKSVTSSNQKIDIRLKDTWNELEKQEDVVVAIINTGIDTSHIEFKESMLNGWDFVNNDNTVYDNGDLSHGTNITGIIASSHDSGEIKGIATNSKILPIKFIDSSGKGYTSDLIKAIIYAKENGAEIINLSFGSKDYNPALEDIIKQNSDILFVCASGNKENTVVYPAGYKLENVISVCGVDEYGEIKTGYTKETDVAALGVNIYTTAPNNNYEYVNGSSIAAATVTGIASLYKGEHNNVSSSELVNIIRKSSDNISSLNNKITWGLVNAYNALFNNGEIEKYEIELEELPEKIRNILDSDIRYTELSDEEKVELRDYLGVREDTMEECQKNGHSIKDSIVRAIIMQQMSISLEETETMIESFRSEKKAKQESQKLREYEYKYDIFDNVELKGEFVKLLIKGYPTDNIINSESVNKIMKKKKKENYSKI